MRKRKYQGFKHKMPNLFFQYEGKRWEVICIVNKIYYAVELSNKGIAQGAVLKFNLSKDFKYVLSPSGRGNT